MTTRPTAPRRSPVRSLAAAAALSLAATTVAAETLPDGSPAADEAKELELLRSMARQARSPVKADDRVVEIGTHPMLGNPAAMLTLIEFSDLQCGFCRRHLNSTLPVLLERYVGTGRMRYVFFDFPVTERHPEAFGAAVTVRIVRRIVGAQPLDVFETAINAVLAEAQGSMAALP